MRDEDYNNCQNVLDRMSRAYDFGVGVRISATEMQSLGLTQFADLWAQRREENPLTAGIDAPTSISANG